MVKLPKMRTAFSSSFLTKYDGCPHSAIFDPFIQGAAAAFGDTVHKLLESLYDARFSFCKADFIHRMAHNFQNGVLSSLDFKKYWEKTEKIDLFLQQGIFDPPEGFEILDIESKNLPAPYQEVINFKEGAKRFFLVPLLDNGKHIRGNIDIVYVNRDKKEILIRDWKSGTSEAKPFQLNLYILAILLAYGLNPDEWKVSAEFMYLEKGKATTVPYDEKELLIFMDEIQAIVNRYYKDYSMKFFKKTPSWDACRFCHIEECTERKGKMM